MANSIMDDFNKIAVVASLKNPVVWIRNPYNSDYVKGNIIANGANALLDIYQTEAERAAVIAFAKMLGCEVDR